MGERDMPAPGPITSNAVRLHTRGQRSCPAELDLSDLGNPHAPVAPVELFDMARLEADLSETLMHASLAPRRATMDAAEEVPHCLGEVAQRLLLHGVRPGRQPVVFGARLGQLRRLLVIARGAASGLPKLLLLDGEVPYKPGMPAMLQQHHLLWRCWQQPKTRHTRNVTNATDTSGHRTSVPVVGAPFRINAGGLPPKENR
jgi:hypothetical protein